MCVKGIQCGSLLAMRTRDPPIIQVEFPTPGPESGSGQKGPGSGSLFYPFSLLEICCLCSLNKKVKGRSKGKSYSTKGQK